MTWQPISTLPKTEDYYPFLGFFGNAKKMHGSRKIAVAYAADGQNLKFKDAVEYGYFYTNPTHWMPLPPEPTVEDKE